MSAILSDLQSREVYIQAGANGPAADLLECKRYTVHNARYFLLKYLLELL